MEHSGQHATISGVPALRQWQMTEGYNATTKVHAGTAGGTDREKGIHNWSGSFSGYGVSAALTPGQLVTAQFFKGPDAAGSLAAGEILTGSIYIEQLTINWAFDTNESINWAVNYGGNGLLSFVNGARPAVPAEDKSTPCAGKIVLVNDAGTVETVIPHLKSASLVLTRSAVASVNSGSTAGVNKCVTTRRKGPALDWTLSLVSEEGNEQANVASGNVSIIRCYVDATRFYELKYGLFLERSGLTADAQTGALIGQTFNAAMKLTKDGVAGVGHVKNLADVSMIL